MADIVMRVENLGKQVESAGEKLVILNNISFSVSSGESVAIVGASGSGKSTLLGLLAGLDIPTTGNAWLGEHCLNALDEDRRAILRGRWIGFVFQSFQLLPAFTALENVMLPLELAGRKDAKETALAWLERVGLSHRLRHTPRLLSGGEQQRVALARAFAVDPKLILADESTGNLDAVTGRQIIDLMFSLNEAHGTTLVLVTHSTALASRCSRCLHLEMGELLDGHSPIQ